jgi:hypothetical protein
VLADDEFIACREKTELCLAALVDIEEVALVGVNPGCDGIVLNPVFKRTVKADVFVHDCFLVDKV